MKKIKILFILIICFGLIPLVFACNKVDPEDDLRDRGFVRITFNCNGGTISTYEKKYIYAKPGSLLIKPGAIPSSLAEPVLLGYYPIDWFLGEEANGEVILSSASWNFDTDRVPDHDITLYVTWEETYYFNFLYGEQFENSYQIAIPRHAGQTADLTQKPVIQDFTIIDCFYDEQMNEIINFATEPLIHPRGEQRNFDVYVKGIRGNFTLVYSAEDFASMSATSNLYLMNDINFSDTAWRVLDVYMGTIEGNGHTILGIDLSVVSTPANYGLFGALNGAVIKDVQFKADITVEIGRVSTFNVGFLAGRIISAELDKVTLEGNLNINITNKDANITAYGEIYGRKDESADYLENDVNTDEVSITINRLS